MNYGLSVLIYKYSESSLVTQAMVLCLWIWLAAWLTQVILFSLSAPDFSQFLCVWCDICVWCCSTWTEWDKKSDWKRYLELQPLTDCLTVLRAWPAQAASSEPCSAHFSTSPKEDTGLIGKLWLSCPLHPFLSDKQLPFPASQPFCLPHLGWTCEQHPVESSCLLWVSSPNRCSL